MGFLLLDSYYIYLEIVIYILFYCYEILIELDLNNDMKLYIRIFKVYVNFVGWILIF